MVMELKEFDFDVDIKRATRTGNVTVVSDDYGTNVFNMTMLNDAVPYDMTGLTAEFVTRKADGTSVQQTMTTGVSIVGNVVSVELSLNAIAFGGIAQGEVRILEGAKVLTSSRFEFRIRDSLMDSSTVESTSEFPILSDLITTVSGLQDDITASIDTVNGFISAENGRVSAEDARVIAEDARVVAEADRVSSFNSYDSRVTNTEIKASTNGDSLQKLQNQMANINVNGESRVTVDDYEAVTHLPKTAGEGGLQSELTGMTLTNMITNGDFSQGTTGWGYLNTTGFTVSSGVASFTATAQNGMISRSIPVVSGSSYFIVADVKADTSLAHIDIAGVGVQYHSGSNAFETLYGKLTWSTTSTNFPFGIRDGRTSGWTQIQAKNAMTINMTALGLDALTSDQMLALVKQGYFEGAKSRVSGRYRSVGKNLLDVGNFYGHMTDNGFIDGYDTLKLTHNTGEFLKFRGKANTRYTFKFDYKYSGSTGFTYLIYYYSDGTTSGTSLGSLSSTSWTSKTIVSAENKTVIGIGQLYSNIGATYFRKDTFQLELGTTSTAYEPYTESTLYTPPTELHRVPNGVADTIEDGKLYRRVRKAVVSESNIIGYYTAKTSFDAVKLSPHIDSHILNYNGSVIVTGFGNAHTSTVSWNDDTLVDMGNILTGISGSGYFLIVPKGAYTVLAEAQADLAGTVLYYQLAEPEITENYSSGSLVAYPNGTIYSEPIVADATVYDSVNGAEILIPEYPIKALEGLSVIDFMTGNQVALDISTAIIAGDGLSFTHPDLLDGDLVAFEYEFSNQTTGGLNSYSYFDSRYTIADDTNGKNYSWKITSSNGVASIVLTEVL